MIARTGTPKQVLIFDEDSRRLQKLSDLFGRLDFAVAACSSKQKALEASTAQTIGILCFDQASQGELKFLEQIKSKQPRLLPVIYTTKRSFDFAKETLNRGAFAYAEAGSNDHELLCHVDRALKESFAERNLLGPQQSLLFEGERIAQVGSWDWNIETDESVWSEQMYRLCGVDRGSFRPSLKTFLHHFVHPDDREGLQASVDEMISSGEPYPMSFRLIRGDGQQRTVFGQGEFSVNEAGEPTRMIGIVQDITDRETIERESAESQARLRLLQDVTTATTLDLSLLYDRLLLGAIEVVSAADLGALYIYDEGKGLLRVAASAGFDCDAFNRILLEPGESIAGKVLRANKASLTRTKGASSLKRGKLRPENERLFDLARGKKEVLSNICTPLRDNSGKAIGVLTLGSVHASFNERDLALLGQVAREIATAIQNGQLHTQARLQAAKMKNEIKERRLVEENLRVSQRRYQTLVESAPLCIHEIGMDGRLLSMNQAGLQMLGVKRESEIVGLKYLEFVRDADRPRIAAHLDRAVNGEASTFEFTSGDLDNPRYFRSSFILISDGLTQRLMGMSEDITERKRREKELWLKDHGIASAMAGIAFGSQRGIIRYVNRAFLEMWGMNRAEVIGRSFSELSVQLARIIAQDSDFLANGGRWSGEDLARRSDGSQFHIALSISAVSDPKQTLLGLIATMIDISDLKRAEKSLRHTNERLSRALQDLEQTQAQVIQQERLRAVGQMAIGVAHDLNNSLSPVVGYSNMLRKMTNLPKRAKRMLELVETCAHDAATVVQRLRDFSRPGHSSSYQEVIDIGKLVQQIPGLTQPKWKDEAQREGKNIDFLVQVDQPPSVLGAASELREVLTNLVINAVDAMPQGGKIRIRAGISHGNAVIEVSDTGDGMPSRVRRMCVEPFFTTKQAGTGLGLSVCHGIVQRHKGRIEFDTAVGDGTTVRILLPAVDKLATVVKEPIDSQLPNWRVLLIDDDARVRELVACMLESLNLRVDMAEDGLAGLHQLQKHDYDIVVTDLGMPKLDGRMLTGRIKGLKPKTPVIMLTGWSVEEVEASSLPYQPDLIVEKPPTLDKLREALTKVAAYRANLPSNQGR